MHDLTDMVDVADDDRLDDTGKCRGVVVAGGIGSRVAAGVVRLEVGDQAGFDACERCAHRGHDVRVVARDIPDAHLVQAADQVGMAGYGLDGGSQVHRVGVAAGRVLAQVGHGR